MKSSRSLPFNPKGIAAPCLLVGFFLSGIALLAQDNVRENSSVSESKPATEVPFPKISITVNWPTLAKAGSALRNSLSDETLAKVDAASLPILLPSDLSTSAALKVSSTQDSITVSTRSPEYSFVLYGSRILYKLPGLQSTTSGSVMSETVRGLPLTVSGEEGLWTATWTEFGVAYMLRTSCSKSEAECEELVRSRVESLVFVGGRH